MPTISKGTRTANDPAIKWTVDENGQDVMPPLLQEFLEWMLDPLPNPPTLVEWANEHEVNVRTTRRWRDDPRFQKIWNEKAQNDFRSTERYTAIMNSLYVTATTRHDAAGVKAAATLLQVMDRFTPKQQLEVSNGDFENLSDAELMKFMEKVEL